MSTDYQARFSKHTPLPWELYGALETSIIAKDRELDKATLVAEVDLGYEHPGIEVKMANAAFIKCGVNLLPEIREKLKQVRAECFHNTTDDQPDPLGLLDLLNRIPV